MKIPERVKAKSEPKGKPEPNHPPLFFSRLHYYQDLSKEVVQWLLDDVQRKLVVRRELFAQGTFEAASKRPSEGSSSDSEHLIMELPLDLKISQMKAVSKSLAVHAVDKFPKLITELIALEITLRAEHGIFYKTTYKNPGYKMREKNRRHEHYITVLEGILERFTTFPLEPPNSSTTAQSSSSTPGDEHIPDSTAISDEPPPEKTAFDHAEIPADEIPMSERPLSDFRLLTEDGEEWDDDAPFQIWCLLKDLATMRRHVSATWKEYANGGISLVTASSVTSQAAELAREMDADLSRTLGETTLYLNYRKVLTHIMELPQNTPHGALWDVIQEQYDPYIADTFMANTWIPLSQYMASAELVEMRMPKETFQSQFDPTADYLSMGPDQRFGKDNALIAGHLNQLHTALLVHNSAAALDESALMGGVRYLFQECDPKGGNNRIPVHIVFQWHLWKDIIYTTGQNLSKPLDELQKVARNVTSAAQEWVRHFPGMDFYPQGDILREEIHEWVTNPIDTLVLSDPVETFQRKHYPPHRQNDIQSHASYRCDPWACGIACSKILGSGYEVGVTTVNCIGYLSCSLQIYNALRRRKKLQKWPMMERVLELCGPTIWKGESPPTNPKEYVEGYNVSMGQNRGLIRGNWDPDFIQTGAGVGSLPQDTKPLTVLLSNVHNFKVTDEIIARVFPRDRPGLDPIRHEGLSNAPPRRSLPGAKLCDPKAYLFNLEKAVENEVKTSALTLDLFNLERLSLQLLKSYHISVQEALKRVLGNDYQILTTNRIPRVAHHYFLTLLVRDTFPSGSKAADCAFIEDKAVEAFNIMRDIFSRLLQEGRAVSYLPGCDPLGEQS